ncbi:C-type lectin 37Db-like [Drosophila subpulchrella]|uniref:C-type lectin 37Db-like n=1 Tax=Drosophila subpulchrella TaxID=1486046 RepID=UPI0018A16E7B|nr:C-type lectin 37Db-like [Drosophila subpulchrella]
MHAYRIFLACAIFASHLYQMDQLGGICFKALNMMLDQSAGDQQPLNATVKEEPQGEVEQETHKTTDKDIPPNFKRIGTKFYYIEKKKGLNWFAAANACVQMGGTLASINSKEELTAIDAELHSNLSYWTGINDLADEGVYKSLASGTAVPFLEWYSGYPTTTKTDKSVSLCQGKMINIPPSYSRHFICQAGKDNK